MSSLLRPVGHLPASVYWVRRAILLAVLLALVLVLFRVVGGGDQKPAAASEPLDSASPAPSTPLSPSAGATASGGDRTKDPTGDPTPGSDPSSTSTPGGGATRDDGRCTGATVRLTVTPAARTVSAGRPLNLQVNLTTTRKSGCKAAVDGRRLELRITSGEDRIWTTRHCEKTVPSATLALAAGKQSTTTVTWNGRRSAAQCRNGQPTAKPGTYVVQAVYDGRPSTEQAFKVA